MSSAVAPEVPQIPIRDIHLSPAPDWWPPAPGWWILAALVLTILIVLTIVQVIRYRRYRRYLKVREELESVERQWREDSDPGKLIRAISRLLRRTVLLAGGDRSLAVMSGKNWAAYLSSISPGDQRVSDAAMVVATQGV